MSSANPKLVSPGQEHGHGSSHGKTVCCPCANLVEQKKELFGTVAMTISAASKQRKNFKERFFACPQHKFAEMNPSVGRRGCAYQGRGFQNMAQLTRHLRRTHQEKISRCLKCQQFFKQEIHNHVCRRTVYTEEVEASPSPNTPFLPQNIGPTSGLETENPVNCMHHASPAVPEVAEVVEVSGLENAVLQQIASLQSAVKLQGLQSATVRAQHLGHIYRSLISHTNILTSGHKISESLEDTRSPESNTATFTTQPPASQNVFSRTPPGAELFPDLPEEVSFGEQDVYANKFSALDWDIEPLSSFSLPWTEQSGYI